LEEPQEKKHGIHNGFMGWFKVAHGFTKKTTRGLLKHVETSKPVENIGEQNPSILKDECYRSWFGLRIEK